MSVQARQTRCPQCNTRFRVTEAQLAVAKGKVRCGQCRTVFNALEHLLEEPLAAVPEATRAETTPTADVAPPPEAEEEHLIKHHPEHAAPPP
ncbi:MAG: DUF3426 domain-containing protein, partial [Halomonadaceae bacterium]